MGVSSEAARFEEPCRASCGTSPCFASSLLRLSLLTFLSFFLSLSLSGSL